MDTHEHKMEVCKIKNQRATVFYQQVNMQGQAAMKSALLINGGASVAMLAFISTAINNDTSNVLLLKLCFSMAMFIAGTFSIAVASGVAYLTGLADSLNDDTDQPDKKTFNWWPILNTITIILVVIGYILFAAGSLNAYCAFTSSLS